MGQHVMVVDDETSITSTLSLILRGAGYEVQAANSGPEALRISEDFIPDVLITDFAMPGMTGLELAIELSKRFPACRVIVFTGQSQISEPKSGRIPKYKLLFKPVPPEEFIHSLQPEQSNRQHLPARPPQALCVDDVEPHRYSIARFLRHAGFDVLEADTGSAGLHLAMERPDVIMLDVGLPDINGIEVCRRLKANPDTTAIPVIHLTASHFESAVREQSVGAGAYDYITAPFDLDYLLARTRSAAQVGYLEAQRGGVRWSA